MKKFFLPLVLLAVFPRQAPCSDRNYSLSLNAQTSMRLSGALAGDSSLGGSLLMETVTDDWFSLGFGFSANYFSGPAGPNPNWVSSLDLFVRALPWNLRQGCSPYVIGGGGINPKLLSPSWQGDYHAFAGLGAWFTLSPNLALDVTALYDFHAPLDNSHQSLGMRAGLSYFFGSLKAPEDSSSFWVKAVSTKPTPEPTLAPAPEPTPPPATPEVHQVKSLKPARKIRANCLWDMAARADIYGDPELYPILVDANIDQLTKPDEIGSIPLAPGKRLIVPRRLTEEQKNIARKNAWKPTYIRWRGKNVVKEEYLKTK